jgi:cytochrome b subunit of formate dehydrogenase
MDAENKAIGESVIFRHALVVRLTHWVNVLCLLVLLMSGLQIFNAHTRLFREQFRPRERGAGDARGAKG